MSYVSDFIAAEQAAERARRRNPDCTCRVGCPAEYHDLCCVTFRRALNKFPHGSPERADLLARNAGRIWDNS